ncbi:MAG: hypothetical protein AB7I48_20760 [Planctomycetaceae bacterium]
MTTPSDDDSDFRRLLLVNRILRGIRDVATIAKALERDREELLSCAGGDASQRETRRDG